MPHFSDARRRARLVRRHLLSGQADDVEQAAAAVVVLHATDPATVYLSLFARCTGATVEAVAQALYERRSLVRLMAMRRTLFVVPQSLVSTVHHAASVEVAVALRRRLLSELTKLATEPELPPDRDGWLAELEDAVVAVLADLGSATGAQLAAAEPRLRTAILPATAKSYDVRRAITSQVITLLGSQGRIVRGRPRGGWTSRQHAWEPAPAYEPMAPDDARARLLAAYLARFGPATESDLAWWTGWTLTTTRTTLAALATTVVEVGGGTAYLLAEDRADDGPAGDSDPDLEPSACLLPALDPTPMGWKQRDWFLPPDPRPLYDAYGNIGPTVWWGGQIIGGWAVTPTGSVATRLLLDQGREAAEQVGAAAATLQQRLGGVPVVPSFPTPLEKELRLG